MRLVWGPTYEEMLHPARYRTRSAGKRAGGERDRSAERDQPLQHHVDAAGRQRKPRRLTALRQRPEIRVLNQFEVMGNCRFRYYVTGNTIVELVADLATRGIGNGWLIEKLTWMGISGIANVLCCIKFAKYYELTGNDVVCTDLTDSAVMYKSRVCELNEMYGDYTVAEAARDHALHMLGLKEDTVSKTVLSTVRGFAPSPDRPFEQEL